MRFHGIEVQVRKKSNSPGDETVEGAPARFVKAVQTVEPKVKPQLTKEIKEGVICLNIGAKE